MIERMQRGQHAGCVCCGWEGDKTIARIVVLGYRIRGRRRDFDGDWVICGIRGSDGAVGGFGVAVGQRGECVAIPSHETDDLTCVFVIHPRLEV